MVPLMMLLAAYDTDASTHGINYHSHVAPHSNCLDIRNVMVPLMVLSRPLYANTYAVVSHDNTNASGITQQKIMLHFISIVFTLRKVMVPLLMLLV